MKTKFLWFLCVFCFTILPLSAQEKFTLSGTISEEKSNETLIGVNIIFPEISAGTTTNEYGFYSMTLPQGTYNIVISYLGYSAISETFTLSEDISRNFKLTDALESLDEVAKIESPIKFEGRIMHAILAPKKIKKKK